jgi:glutamyl-tRNA reductase
MNSIENKMPNLTDRERKILNKHTKSIINQLLKEPILQAKELANSPNANEHLQLFQQIFGIEDDVQEELVQQHLKVSKTLDRTEPVGSPKLSY